MKKRVVVNASDVARITGRTERYGRLVLQRIREKLKKEKYQLVSKSELSEYLGLKMEEIDEFIL